MPPLDKDGFLRDSSDWNRDVAAALAAEEGIALDKAHWEVLELLRRYYATYDSSPAMRALVKYCRQELGADKGTSLYLLKLFPGSPAKVGARLAGLPRPANCL
ncbi:TusE/DsrC/DsvC family sulfur relay protein [Pseudohaliea sp.]|uniref:TusE/DsrC/DsvC family sulfur relay protein n=1 Tax=Pseudohaliea sp. TaxID=2740289 RepID=UPI0032EC3953